MTLGQKLAIDALRRDLRDLAEIIKNGYDGPSWKEPNKKSCDIEIEDYLVQFDFNDDFDEDRRSQIGLLEALIDRLHFMLLSMAECDSKNFVSLGKAARKLNSKVINLKVNRHKERSNINHLQLGVSSFQFLKISKHLGAQMKRNLLVEQQNSDPTVLGLNKSLVERKRLKYFLLAKLRRRSKAGNVSHSRQSYHCAVKYFR